MIPIPPLSIAGPVWEKMADLTHHSVALSKILAGELVHSTQVPNPVAWSLATTVSHPLIHTEPLVSRPILVLLALVISVDVLWQAVPKIHTPVCHVLQQLAATASPVPTQKAPLPSLRILVRMP